MLLTLVILASIALLYAARQAPAANGPRLTTLIAEQQIATWNCQDQMGWPRTRASLSPWALPRSHAYRRWVLRLWTQRHGICTAALHERERQWNWQQWLPPVWRAIAMCETQINWQHDSGTYQGSFGFARSSWDAFAPAGYPSEAYLASPWQQYQVALRIHARYGFTGWGCYTHGGYRVWLGNV